MYIEDVVRNTIVEVIEDHFIDRDETYEFVCINKFEFNSSYELLVEVSHGGYIDLLGVYVVEYENSLEIEFSNVYLNSRDLIKIVVIE